MDNDMMYIDRLKEAALTIKEVPDNAIISNFQTSMRKLGECESAGRKEIIEQLKTFVKNFIGKDQSLIQHAVKAYHSAISSYASHSIKHKQIFNYKEMNFTDLVYSFYLY